MNESIFNQRLFIDKIVAEGSEEDIKKLQEAFEDPELGEFIKSKLLNSIQSGIFQKSQDLIPLIVKYRRSIGGVMRRFGTLDSGEIPAKSNCSPNLDEYDIMPDKGVYEGKFGNWGE